MSKTIIIEVSGGVVQEVWNADDGYIIVDYDSGDAPELPNGYRYGTYGVEEDD